MANNTFSFNQCSTLLNSIQEQATGKTGIAATDESSFVTVAKSVLENASPDLIIGAISQVLSRTIFSVRAYDRKFKGLAMDNQAYGNHVRKLQVIDKPFINEDKYGLTDGQSVDQQVVTKPAVLQTNFYGFNAYEKSITLFDDQLNQAFNSSAEFGSFIGMVLQNMSDTIEQAHENLARACLCNFINGKVVAQNGVIHLLTEYNTETGLSLTATDVYKPANFKPFMQWVYARIADASALLTERSLKNHINITGKEISRHTPMADQLVYLYAPAKFKTEAMVLADTYHDNFIRYADTETVNFWQSIDSRDTISTTPVYLDATTGNIKVGDPTVTSKVFGVILDREAVGYTVVSTSVDTAPHNARGKYTTMWYHWAERYFNDFTENGLVLLLD